MQGFVVSISVNNTANMSILSDLTNQSIIPGSGIGGIKRLSTGSPVFVYPQATLGSRRSPNNYDRAALAGY